MEPDMVERMVIPWLQFLFLVVYVLQRDNS